MKTSGICYGIWRSNCAHDASEYWEEIQGNIYATKEQAIEALKKYAANIDRQWIINNIKDYSYGIICSPDETKISVDVIENQNEVLADHYGSAIVKVTVSMILTWGSGMKTEKVETFAPFWTQAFRFCG